ncbi:MAG: hydrogenase expression/formation protein HypE [Candidatus Bathyarchaeota archaeon]|nr:MAG: hydrogenase expression/formation protein HypE [Candidatus Bathyarchaeota archaeon]
MQNSERIIMAHGAGGAVMGTLIERFVLPYLGGFQTEVGLEALDDAAVVGEVVFKSDSHVVRPIFFPGGDIGRLAVAGTVNDLAVLGAEPVALGCGFVLEEGLDFSDFELVLESMKTSCDEAGVFVVTGDTKVVEKGALGGLVVNMSGIGKRSKALAHNLAVVRKCWRNFDARWVLDKNLRVGNKIILSGTIGDHGLAVLSAQEGLTFGSKIASDVKPLNHMIEQVLEVGGVVSMKDPTRGGLANALNEWSVKAKVGILVHEENIPIRNDVRIGCEMLGIDPLEVGNEGKIILGVEDEMTNDVLAVLKRTKEGKDAEIIGEVTDEFSLVAMKTVVGGRRILPMPVGDPVPRIC